MKGNLDEEGEYRVYVLDNKKLRSPRANRYLWFCYGIIADHIGYEPETVHELMKAKHNVQTIKIGQYLEEIPGSTAIMNSTDFAHYVDKVRQWASEMLGLHIPLPNEIPDDDLLEIINQGK